MKYDRAWFCESLNRKFWSEYSKLVDEGRKEEAEHNWLRFQGDELRFAVLLVAGSYWEFEELYVFLNEADARRFFEGGPLKDGEEGYRQREHVSDDGSPVGFEERSLYISGTRIECDMSGDKKDEM
jgi:hypothetical protein